MDDILLLKPSSDFQAQDLGPGEIGIDQTARMLYFDRGDSHPPEGVPLDVLPLPKTPFDPDPALVLVMGPSGPEYAILAAGGGARPLETGWTVPGVIPRSFSSEAAYPELTAIFDLGESVVVTALRFDCEVHLGLNVTFGLATEAGASLVEFIEDASGVIERACSVALDPGRYMLYVRPQNTLAATTMKAVRAYGGGVERYPLAIKVTYAA